MPFAPSSTTYLLPTSCPSNIAYFVVTVVIDAVKGAFTIRSAAYMSNKLGKRCE